MAKKDDEESPCPSCGVLIPDGMEECPNCGTKPPRTKSDKGEVSQFAEDMGLEESYISTKKKGSGEDGQDKNILADSKKTVKERRKNTKENQGKITCPLCGTEVPKGVDECPGCGAHFKETWF